MLFYECLYSHRFLIHGLNVSRCHSALLADSSQLTAYSSQLIAFIFLPSVITQNGGRKRIFILFFCVIPPSQYPPSGFAGHLLINKEACPIPILPFRIPFLNTAANPLLALWMTPYRPPSFWTGASMPCEKIGKQSSDMEWRIYYADDILPLSSPR